MPVGKLATPSLNRGAEPPEIYQGGGAVAYSSIFLVKNGDWKALRVHMKVMTRGCQVNAPFPSRVSSPTKGARTIKPWTSMEKFIFVTLFI